MAYDHMLCNRAGNSNIRGRQGSMAIHNAALAEIAERQSMQMAVADQGRSTTHEHTEWAERANGNSEHAHGNCAVGTACRQAFAEQGGHGRLQNCCCCCFATANRLLLPATAATAAAGADAVSQTQGMA